VDLSELSWVGYGWVGFCVLMWMCIRWDGWSRDMLKWTLVFESTQKTRDGSSGSIPQAWSSVNARDNSLSISACILTLACHPYIVYST
jgi:hypothetical protein